MCDEGIADLMKVLIEDRKSRDARFEEERKRQLQAAELEKAQMREQMEMLRKLVEDSRRTEETRTPAGRVGKEGEAKLVKLSEQDDIHSAKSHIVRGDRCLKDYGFRLSQARVDSAECFYSNCTNKSITRACSVYLTGKAQLAFAAMRAEDTGSYRCLIDAILRRYDISEETYRRRFREAVKKEEETVSELTVRLNDLLQKWTKECKTVEDIRDMMVQEQLLDALPRELKIWVAERKPMPKRSKETAELADNYLRARKHEHRTEPSVLPVEDIQPEVWNMGEELDGSIFIGGRERPLLSRSQKRDGRTQRLLYGREVRGPLYVLQESWVARERNTESVVSHVLAIRERMEQMSSLVKESLEKAQQSQKACPVARALQGYQAAHRTTEDRFGRLKREFAQVLANTPGRTQFAEHCIETGSARPVRLPAYRIPHADRETVRQEIEEMLEEGILVHSNSEWSSPIVLVGKKDGSLRLCVDYRRLNSLSEADAYPMPRIDEMLEQLGTARFISTLDLTRGYWQVPVAKEARHKTAFVTPFGLYHFNVMPFGLQGAPCYTFQRLMEGVIRAGALKGSSCDEFPAIPSTKTQYSAVQTSRSHLCSRRTPRIVKSELCLVKRTRHAGDDNPIAYFIWMDKLKDSNSRLTRWSLSMQPFNFTVVHRAGQANGNADALSRAPGSSCASNKFAAGEEGKDMGDHGISQ
eukprot:Em0001g2480a